jgi:Fic family protein
MRALARGRRPAVDGRVTANATSCAAFYFTVHRRRSWANRLVARLAETIQRHRKDYYTQLQRASLSNHIDEWLDWFSEIVLEAQQRTLVRVNFLLAKAKLLSPLHGQINARQEKALLRMFVEGPDGFEGGLSAANYRTITDVAPATATRDLAELVELEALCKYGELKHTRYHLNIGG